MLNKLKIMLLKLVFGIMLVDDKSLSITERVEYFFKSLMALAPIAFLVELSRDWILDNKEFTSAIVLIVLINMGVGAYMHFKKKSFKWKDFIVKSVTMIVVINITYIVLELILGRAGDNVIVDGFRAALQVATLLYPGSKILKNIFILSNGEHPPKWIMERIYNFQENGDLSELFKSEKQEEDQSESEYID